MSFKYIFDRVASEAGVQPDDNPEQKARLVDIINEAAEEVYENKDLPISLKELYLRANSNKELALPPIIGEPRAIRSTLRNDAWELHDIRPRYQAQDWRSEWKNWRIKGYSCFQTEITNAAPGTITYPVVDEELIITFVGATDNSNRAIETVTMDAVSKTWTNSYIDLIALRKNKVTPYNVTITDADGVEMAVLFADQLESRYIIVDISRYPDLHCCPDGTYIMEVLYKPRLQRMEEDEDTFPVDGFDNVIILKAKQLLLEGQEGKEQRAILAHSKVELKIKKKTEDKTGTQQKRINFTRNKLFGLFNRGNYWRERDSRYGR